MGPLSLEQAIAEIESWLGANPIESRTPRGDVQLMSRDRTRIIRFDLSSDPAHINLQVFAPSRISGRMRETANEHVPLRGS